VAEASGEARLLEVEDLSVTFSTPRGRVHAVDGVSLAADEGRTVGIVGESGSGKSVLARSIMGLTAARGGEVGGRVSVRGRDVGAMSPRQLRDLRGREVAMVFQDPMSSLNPVLRIGRQISETMIRHLGYSKARANERAVELLGQVGIPSPERRLRDYPHQMSGGMRQRVVIAIALACEPHLLLADEPTTALDVTVQAQILELLATQRRERQMGMVLITHDFGVVASRSDEIVVMYGGQIVERAPSAELLANPMMPYTSALIRSIPTTDRPIHSRLSVIEGRPPDLIGRRQGCRFAPRCPKAQDKCRTDAPPLLAADRSGPTEHLYRCWFPDGVEAPAEVAVGVGAGAVGAVAGASAPMATGAGSEDMEAADGR
jgi:oligopeptide/dipeptide ABC transporter ATP-binding protein